MSDPLTRVITAAQMGAVGAFVGAVLSAFSEPMVNRILVQRITLGEALDRFSLKETMKFFETTVMTNFIKFPFFEAVNIIMSMVDVSPSLRGMVTGAVFTTTTLPITNYRYRKSVGAPIEMDKLYQAYIPTVLRDIVYGIVRNNITAALLASNPERAKTDFGRFFNMWATVIAACVISAPGNEYRGYTLQPPDRKKPFKDFFQPKNFLRSTITGSLIMSSALGSAAFLTPKIQSLVDKIREYLKQNPLAYTLIGLYMVHRALEARKGKEKQSS